MMYDLLTFLPLILAGGAALVLTVLSIRLADQYRRDKARDVITIRYPRNLTEERETADTRAMLGLAPATTGVSGRDSVAVEVVGTAGGITFRRRVPANASSYLISQLRVG